MAINFNENSVFNLTPISFNEIRREVDLLLLEDEEICEAFKTVRDQLIFTNKRIIAIDVQGLTGVRKSYSSLPYSKIQFFSIQSQGLIEIFPDSEMFIQFSNGFTAKFEFKGAYDIASLGRLISKYVL